MVCITTERGRADAAGAQAGKAKPGRLGDRPAALAAAAVMLALTVWGRGPALALAGALVGPLPALRTALEWGRQAAGEAPDAESAGEAPASSTAPAPALDPTAIERYLVPLLTDADKPADAGAVTETSYGQGSGEKYIACAAAPSRTTPASPPRWRLKCRTPCLFPSS